MVDPGKRAEESGSRPAAWHFVLYVLKGNAASERAETALLHLAEQYLAGDYEIEVVDIRDNLDAVPPDVLAVPTVIKRLPQPERRVIGDLSITDKVLTGLGIPRHG